MTALAQLLFANELSLTGAVVNSPAATNAVPPARQGEDFISLLQQMFAGSDPSLRGQLPGAVSATQLMQLPAVQADSQSASLLSLIQSLTGENVDLSVAPVVSPAAAQDSRQIDILGQLQLVDGDGSLSRITLEQLQDWLTAQSPENLSAVITESDDLAQAGPDQQSPQAVELLAALQSLPLAEAGFLQLSFAPADEPSNGTGGANWQVLLPLTSDTGLGAAEQPMQVLLVSTETSAEGGQQPLILPATIEVAASELPRLTQLIQQFQQQAAAPAASPQSDILSSESRTPETGQPISLPSTGSLDQRALTQEPIVIATKLTIDAQVLDQLLKQAVQQHATGAPALKPAAVVPVQSQPSPSGLPISAAPVSTLIVKASDGIAKGFVDLNGDSQQGLPHQSTQSLESVAGQVGANPVAPSQSFETAINHVDSAPRTELEDNWHAARVSFSQAQLNSLLKRGEVKMHLSPPELGEMRVELHTSATQTTARFELQSEAARQIVEHNLPQLRDSLERAGIRVGQFEVVLTGDGQQRRAAAQPRPTAQTFLTNDGSEEKPAAAESRMRTITHLGRINLIA
ncbi:MAG: flagellar hook-length control protein FliK [bacterium]